MEKITAKQFRHEVIRILACGLLFGCVVAWAWTTAPHNQARPSEMTHEAR